MNYGLQHTTLFEVSWEVCNKVGGIYSVVSSKALHAVDNFGENFYLLGPDLHNNAEFEETDEAVWEKIRPVLQHKDLKCRLGRWNIPGRPKAILVDAAGRYNTNQLLYEIWKLYGVDSLSGAWDYIEPVMFSYACGEVIAAIHQALIEPEKGRSVAQFHEWMCGAGLLAVKKLAPTIGTVFTTHATMLGRALAGSGVNIYRQMTRINPRQEAAKHNITAKCSMESISARQADCFTTVSHITADEATAFLGRTPDIVTPNGLDMRVIPDYSKDRQTPAALRARLLDALAPLLRRRLPDETRIIVISGRYEFHNKGIDVFLEALASVNQALRQSASTPVLALCLVMGGHSGLNPTALSEDAARNSNDLFSISPYQVWDRPHDAILNACRRLGLTNNVDDAVQLIFIPAMLNGQDGLLNMPYYDVLSACDLGVFPSWYEPWGYTPHESAAHAVPTITTDLSGFGIWVRQEQHTEENGVLVLCRRQNTDSDVAEDLKKLLLRQYALSDTERAAQRSAARAIALRSSWEHFFPHYLTAYNLALSNVQKNNPPDQEDREIFQHVLTAAASTTPYLREITAVADLPPALERLRELSRNLWWSWNPGARGLFMALNPQAWQNTDHNPVRMIEEVAPERLHALSSSDAYLAFYEQVLREFDAYMARGLENVDENLRTDSPVAYFSTEYGLHESLTIYSGGLGVLSGDHLKSASDLRLPLVAVGLLYKNGYFRQTIDKNGRQIANYPENNFDALPVEAVLDANGEHISIQLDLPGRTLHALIWLVRVGRIQLYLLDTDTPLNTEDDRKITARLYEADRDYRLRQEMLLGMGGVRLLRRMGIRPSVYHINEGHSAFLLIERIRSLMERHALSFGEAAERVRSNTIFTTHTPVEAGNEHFSVEIMERYFKSYADALHLSWPEFLQLGHRDDADRHAPFEMTILALRLSSQANGVSRMHGIVSRHMWHPLWKSIPVAEIPIRHVTNGIHVPSYVGIGMKPLLDSHLGPDWMHAAPEDPCWEKVRDIPDELYWNARLQQKEALLDLLRDAAAEYTRKYALPPESRKELFRNITPDTLIIGFARRFAPYKRANLPFAAPERLARLLNQTKRPVLLVYAGKAHPADEAGIQLIQEVIGHSLEPRFLGKIIFVEDYSLAVSRILAQGCDVWLNTPRRPREASGTSGQKLPVNGGINLSISDGWWCEGYNRSNGWTIGPVLRNELPNDSQSDYADAESLYTLLEDTVIPLYFERDDNGLPRRWIQISKESLRSLTAMYSSHRMLRDYITQYYQPAAARNVRSLANDMEIPRRLAAWRAALPVRFGTAAIKDISISGMEDGLLHCGRPISIQLRVQPGDLLPNEIQAQLVIGPCNRQGDFAREPDVLTLTLRKNHSDTLLTFTGSYQIAQNGRYVYGVRILPVTQDLYCPLKTNLILWG